MAKGDAKKEPEPEFKVNPEEVEAEVRFQAAAAREMQIGRTAEKILLSYADKKPGEFLDVKFAQKVRNVALVIHGEKPKAEPKAKAKPEPEAHTEEGKLDLDAE